MTNILRLILILFCLLLVQPLKANEADQPALSAEKLKRIQDKTLNLLQDIAPAGSSGRAMETMELDAGVIYWGNLFDPNEVVALVDLAPEQPPDDDGGTPWSKNCWPCYFSLCVWKKAHWVYRQYIDNANTIFYHVRKDSPKYFVQAKRITGHYEGDYLSWYYDPKTKTLLPTPFQGWGRFYLVGNYLCTTRGYERLARQDTTWIYAYKQGKEGDLVAIYYVDNSRDGHFFIAFRDSQTKKFWTYSFETEDEKAPFLNYSVKAMEGNAVEDVEVSPSVTSLYSGNMKLSKGDEPVGSLCFERLTGLNAAILDENADWNDNLSNTPLTKLVKIEISGDPEIVRHLKNP